MVSFWDDSWNKIDTARLSKYIESFDMTPDKITDFLISCGAKKYAMPDADAASIH